MSTSTNTTSPGDPSTGSTAPTAGGELSKQYRPSEHEERIWSNWVAAKAFHANPDRVLSGEAKPYAIVIPPPNVTDRLHLGHALNNSLQDILTRAHRMMGYETLWMPGTDHAGIATQAVVEKRLRASGELKGPLRESMTRDAFVAKAQAFKDEYEAVILGQLKRMGCSCDWDRTRFTMDEVCARAVREAFFIMFKDGLIYRGKRLVNWDPALQTAVADDECFDEEIDGAFYYLRYPLVHKGNKGEDAAPVTWNELASRGYPGASDHPGDDEAWITVATTRPETYLGDTAVALNPHDPRAKALRGLFVELPLVGRVIPILEDSYVVLPEIYARTDEERADPKAKMATGFLKVTPAHDPNDYELGHRHKAAIEAAGHAVLINVMAPDGSISDKHGWSDIGDARLFVGLSREDARKKVIAEFKSHGLLEGQKPHRHSVKHSDRSKAIIEPYLSDQWYVKVTDSRMAQAANAPLRAGDLQFHPARYAKTYEQWHDNIRDWCISRQLWWGHRVPVWTRRLDFTNPAARDKDGFTLEDRLTSSDVDEMGPKDRNCIARFVDVSTGEVFEGKEGHFDFERLRGRVVDAYICIREEGWNTEFVKHLESWGQFQRDKDVLDTWFSSALWPMSTMHWPENSPLLRAFNPSSTLCTAREIITLWVSRMVMFNRYLRGSELGADEAARGTGPLPFKNVFIHAVIQDGHGQKMSKSLGNGVDPLDIISSHGADAMRFTLCHMTTQTQDVRMPVDLVCPHTGEVFAPKMITNKDGYTVAAPIQESPKDKTKKMVTVYGVASGEAKASAEMPLAKTTSSKFDLGRNFANKLWNASRFTLGILGAAGTASSPNPHSQLPTPALLDRWLLSRLATAVSEVNASLASFEFSSYATTMYDLLWRDFCDWYLEGIKPTVANDAHQRAVLANALESILRLLHPVMPFVTEAIWEKVRDLKSAPVAGITLGPARNNGLLATAGWPIVAESLKDAEAEEEFERVRSLVTSIRDVRAQHQVLPRRKVTLHIPAGFALDADATALASTFANLELVTKDAPRAEAASTGVVAFSFDGQQFHLSNLRDAAAAGASNDAEKARLTKLVADLTKSVATLEGRLNNPGYADKAPPHMVQQSKDQLAKAKAELATAQATLGTLA
jgi:valyl-tRNA synthetase